MDSILTRPAGLHGKSGVFSYLLALALSGGMLAAAADAATTTTSRLVNLSSRATVSPGSEVLIAGFVIGGVVPKDVLVRAVGPTLSQRGLSGILQRPRLQVFDVRGQLIATQERWDPALKSAFASSGAAGWPDNSNDAALRLTLAPGAYTAQVSGVGSTSGVALVEVFELDGASRLLNLSTRAKVDSGEGVLISGLVIAGNGPRKLLLRAAGPALALYNLSGWLPNPVLTLLNAAGQPMASNDDWEESNAMAIASASAVCGAVPFSAGARDAALLVDVSPGLYSVHVKDPAGSTGLAMLEVYDVSAIEAETGSSATELLSLPGTYSDSSLSWALGDVDARLGPRWEQLNAFAADDRPTLPAREAKTPPANYYVRIKPYELGAPGPDSDYWSDSGQVAYVPLSPATDPGLDRIQTFAYYNKVFAISPRLDWASGKPHPDLQTLEPAYVTLNGGPLRQPVAMVRNYAMEQNEEIVIYQGGLFAVAGTQTSRSGSERPYPAFKFPAHKVPRAVAVTTSNEFALVAIWDTDRHVGQLAVVALEGKYLPFHTWPYMALPNQGSFSAFKLLGYIDLPMAAPDAVAAASNGLWTSPSSTAGKVLSEIRLAEDGYRKLVYDGDWQAVVARNGYAIVSSKEDNRAAVVDLTPLLAYVRESWLASAENFQATLAARGAAPAQFPQTFDVNPAIKPRVVWHTPVRKPTAVLAGQKLDRWSKDRFKAYVATEEGTIHIVDTSSLMQRNSWETRAPLQMIGTVQVGRNPVSMAWARHGGVSDLPLLPNDSTGKQRAPDPLNNLFYVACRGDRSIDAVVTWQGDGAVYNRIRDRRLGDPVAVSVARRGPIVTVADFTGRKLLSYRIGTLRDSRNKVDYLLLDPSLRHEFAGELTLPGSPFLVNSTNVN